MLSPACERLENAKLGFGWKIREGFLTWACGCPSSEAIGDLRLPLRAVLCEGFWLRDAPRLSQMFWTFISTYEDQRGQSFTPEMRRQDVENSDHGVARWLGDSEVNVRSRLPDELLFREVADLWPKVKFFETF
jgi:hypothetical protein